MAVISELKINNKDYQDYHGRKNVRIIEYDGVQYNYAHPSSASIISNNTVYANFAVNEPLRVLSIYGNSLQEGTPTPQSPIPIKSAGDNGISIFNGAETIIIPHVIGAVTLNFAKIGSVADNLTKNYDGNVIYTQRIGYIASYSGEQITTAYLSTTGSLTTGASVYYVLPNEITYELTDTEIGKQLQVFGTIFTQTYISVTSTPTISGLTANYWQSYVAVTVNKSCFLPIDEYNPLFSYTGFLFTDSQLVATNFFLK